MEHNNEVKESCGDKCYVRSSLYIIFNISMQTNVYYMNIYKHTVGRCRVTCGIHWPTNGLKQQIVIMFMLRTYEKALYTMGE